MRKLLLATAFIIGLPILALAEPVPLDNTVSPCDSSGSTDKPSCDTDSGSVKVPPPLPNEEGGVIVPPEIPAEGLPGRKDRADPGLPQPATPPRP
jgi:hypothetical protein